MHRACDSCGSLYQPVRQTSRYCSGACRKRAQRAGIATPKTPKDDRPDPRRRVPQGTVTAAVLAELTAAKRETSALGQACIALAQRIDHGTAESGSAIASLSRELRAALEHTLGARSSQADVLDELAEQRRKRLAGGSPP
jgi:hypothetical protein